MPDIYQQIWSADQDNNGLEALLSNQSGDAGQGFVKVNADMVSSRNPDFRLIPEVSIPSAKRESYELCRKLFNNYALPEADFESDSLVERAERHEFVEAISNSAPMQVAREYIERRTETLLSAERWHTTLMDHWFRRFEQGGDPHLTGFEHVLVGEQEGRKAQGYHFWYKYYLDDGFAHRVDDELGGEAAARRDRITYVRAHSTAEQLDFPESVVIQYAWHAFDYEDLAYRTLHKRKGGFFVGCSAEGLMALGTVRAHVGAQAPKTAVIEGARYDMKLYRSSNNRHIRTFYPVFRGPADPVSEPGGSPDLPPVPRPPAPPRPSPPSSPTPAPLPAGPGRDIDVRIIAAFVNPAGHDVGHEAVILINAGPERVRLGGWRIQDKNGNADTLDASDLEPGRTHTVVLDGKGAQLSNKGSNIALIRPTGELQHRVSYSKAQARAQNRTIVFG